MCSESEFERLVGIVYPIKHNPFVLFRERWEKAGLSGLWFGIIIACFQVVGNVPKGMAELYSLAK